MINLEIGTQRREQILVKKKSTFVPKRLQIQSALAAKLGQDSGGDPYRHVC